MSFGRSVLLLSAVGTASALTVCDSISSTELCFTFGVERSPVVDSCLYGVYTAVESTEQVTATVSESATTFAEMTSYDLTLSCADNVLQMDFAGVANLVAEASKLGAGVGSSDLSVQVSASGLSWTGKLLEGDIGSAGGLTGSYELHQSESAMHTFMHVDITDEDDDAVELGLPTRVTVDVVGNPFFDGSLTAPTTCPFNPLVGTPPLSIPGVEAELLLEAASFDPCALVASRTDIPVVVVGATLESSLSVRGVAVDEVSAEVRGTISGDQVAWGGDLSATGTLLGTTATVSGTFDKAVLLSVSAAFEATYTGFSLSGSVALGEDSCGATGTEGTAMLSMPSAGLTASLAVQQTGCAGETTTRLWEVTGSVPSILVEGVAVSDVVVALVSAADGEWSGTLGGSVTFGSSGSVTAVVGVHSATGVTSFEAAGTFATGPVSGDVEVSIAGGVARGSGVLSLTASNGAVPSFAASVTKVLNYDEENAALPLWNVQGSLDSLDLFGADLTGVSVSLEGKVAGGGGATSWSGTVSGTVDIGEASVEVQAEVLENALSSLKGSLSVGGSGVSFEGEVEIAPGRDGCAPIDGSGTLTLGSEEVFDATMAYSSCATGAGETRFGFEGTYDGDLSLGGLTLSTATFVMDAKVKAGSGYDWSGELSATADLFGASSRATVAFSSGSLQAVHVHTAFTTDNQIFSATVDFTYNTGCVASSGVVTDAVLRLDGASDLTFSGTVTYESCSGVMTLAGSVGGWNGPAGTALSGVTIDLTSSTNGGDAGATLASRTWIGSVTATTSAGLEFALDFDSTQSASSVTGTITYEDSHVKASVALSSDCTGSGTLIVRNLKNIPSVEAQATFSKDCGSGATSAWSLSGTFTGLTIPFNGKVISLPSVTVALEQDAAGEKQVSLRGDYLSSFFLEVEFTVGGGGGNDVVLRGGLRSGSAASPDSFSSEFSGQSQFPAALGNAGGMLDSMKGLSLEEVVLEVSFTAKSILLQASGEVFGVDFSIVVAAAKASSGWRYGMAFQASDFASASGLPGPVKSALQNLGPEYVRFSIAKETFEVGGVELRRGLSLAAHLELNSAVIGDVLAVAPGPLRSRINTAGAAAGLTVVADILSTTELNVWVQLAGDVPLGNDVSLRTVALAFKISGTGSPEMGFLVQLDFTIGGGSDAEEFTASGFIGLSAGGLTIGLSLERDEPWVRPFGINGVSVLFPLGIEMTVSPALLPSSFALIGGLQVAGVSGEIVLSADVADLAKTAFKVKVEDFDLKKIVTGIAGCNSCLGSVGNTLATASIDLLEGSFNPDPVNAVVVTAGAASATIPAGINVEVRDMNLWNVVKIERGVFRVRATGFEAVLEAKKVDWGPIELTSADGTKGPSFELVLKSTEQRLGVDGRAKILGKTVSVYIAFSDTSFVGSFLYSIGSSFQVAVELTSTGTPGTGGFSSSLSATVEGDPITAVISQATAFLDTISSSADSALQSANRKLDKANEDLDDAKSDLDKAEKKATDDLKDARDDVASLKNKLDSKHSSCKSKEKKCRKKPWKCGAVAGCWTEYAAIKAAKETAQATLNALIKTTEKSIKAAKATVSTAQDAVDAAKSTVNAAKSVTTAISDLASSVGGALGNVLKVHSVTFTAGLTSSSAAVSFYARIKVVNTNINFGFSANPTFSAIKNQIESKTRQRLRSVYGGSIPDL